MTSEFVLSKTQKELNAAAKDLLRSLPPVPEFDEERIAETMRTIKRVSIVELHAMSLDDARNAVNESTVILTSTDRSSPYFGQRGLAAFLELLHVTDPNKDAPETLEKEREQ